MTAYDNEIVINYSQDIIPMTDRQPHPQRCETCENNKCPAKQADLDDPYHCAHIWISQVGCASHSSQPVPDSATLIQIAKTDWHNREERFGLHDEISWTTGWMAGYLTTNKPDWSKEHDAAIAKAERGRVLRGKLEIIDSEIEKFSPPIQSERAEGFHQGLRYARNRIFGTEQESLRGGEP